jgi:hypothetical protein
MILISGICDNLSKKRQQQQATATASHIVSQTTDISLKRSSLQEHK